MPSGIYDRKIFSAEVKDWIRLHASEEIKLVELASMASSEFGMQITYNQIKGLAFREKIPFRKNVRHNLLLTDEQAEWLASIIPGRSSDECAKMMNEKYHLDLSQAQVRSWKKNHKVPSGYDTRYRKGNRPWIAGKKYPGRKNSGCWEKGHIAYNNIPEGSVRIHSGYKVIKIKDGARNDNFMFLHRYVWEQANGPVPDGHVLTFVDGDPMNCDLSNIRCISMVANGIANLQIGRVKGEQGLNDAVLSLAMLQAQINQRGSKDGDYDRKTETVQGDPERN